MTIVLAEVEGDPIEPHSTGDAYQIRCGITLSSTYKTGGDITISEALETQLKQIGAGTIVWLDVQGDAKGYIFSYNYATKKLLVYRTGAAVKGALEELPEEAYPAAITGAKLRVLCIGK